MPFQEYLLFDLVYAYSIWRYLFYQYNYTYNSQQRLSIHLANYFPFHSSLSGLRIWIDTVLPIIASALVKT